MTIVTTSQGSASAQKHSKNEQHNSGGDGNVEMCTEFCQEEDVLIDNPQKRLKCLLCGLNGERSITGRLVPF